MGKYIRLDDVIKTITDPHEACPHEGCSNCEFAKYDGNGECEIIYCINTLPTVELLRTADHLALIKWCKMALDGWSDVITNTVTEEGIRLNKFGAEQLRNDLYEVGKVLCTLEDSPENKEDK